MIHVYDVLYMWRTQGSIYKGFRCDDSKIDYKKTDKVLAVREDGNRATSGHDICFGHTRNVYAASASSLSLSLQASVRAHGSDKDR